MDQGGRITRVFLKADMPAPEEIDVDDGSISVISQRSPAKQTANEDAAAVIRLDDSTAVFVLADGMGGGAAGERAAEIAIQSLTDSLATFQPAGETPLRTAILNGIEAANQLICNLGLGAGTTLAAVGLEGTLARPYHVGDSLILLVSNRGRVKLQTVSHSPVGYGLEAGLLDEVSAMNHEDRHLISNVVGSPEMRIEVGAPFEIAARDTLLLASDGLSDNLHLDEITEIIRKGPLRTRIQQLAGHARHRMDAAGESAPCKPDDLTILGYRRRIKKE